MFWTTPTAVSFAILVTGAVAGIVGLLIQQPVTTFGY